MTKRAQTIRIRPETKIRSYIVNILFFNSCKRISLQRGENSERILRKFLNSEVNSSFISLLFEKHS